MNILFFSQAAWDNRNSVGNTFSNLFDGEVWERNNFYHIYARENHPDNNIDINYYHISASSTIKGIIRHKPKATEFNSAQIITTNNNYCYVDNIEQKRIDRIHKTNSDFIYWAHEQVWRTKLWQDKQFSDFVSRSSPDILFAFATSSFILWPLIQYLKKNTQCKVVLLIADDTYGAVDNCAWYRRIYLKKDLYQCIVAADKLYAISDEMSERYSRLFNRKVTTLYKGCDLSTEPKGYVNNPMRFVYAGNLFWGRDDILAAVAEAIETQNRNGLQATLDIYTTTTITMELDKKLNRGDSSVVLGSRPYEEIKEIMHEADVVLHVESFDERMIETVKYSLSTKIIDCLQSGAQVMGIGPNGIASIEYLKKVDGAIVCDNKDEIGQQISTLLKDNWIQERIQKIREYSLKKHEKCKVQSELKNDIELLLS